LQDFSVGTAIFQVLSFVFPLLILCLIIFVFKSISRSSKKIKSVEKQNKEILNELSKVNDKLDKQYFN
jgi:hypothetical protein